MRERSLMRNAALAASFTIMAALAIGASAASAREVVYSNLNTVPTVGPRTEATWSQAFTGSAGGMVEFGGTYRVLKTITAEVDSFRCEKGVYNLENCWSKEGKKFKAELTVKVYNVSGSDERGSLLASMTDTFKLPYRPSTNVECPDIEGEGKGFGANCYVGGVLASVTFKGFSGVTLPSKAIIEIVEPTPGPINVGLEAAEGGKSNNWEAVPGSGNPAVGHIPLAGDIFLNGLASETPNPGGQPVFSVEAAK